MQEIPGVAFDSMSSDEDRRGRTFHKKWPDWWLAAVREAMAKRRTEDGGKFTQHSLAVALGYSDEMVSRCLNNKVPTIEVMERISDFLGVPRAIGLIDQAMLESKVSGIQEVVRRNAGKFRIEAKLSQGQAADLAELSLESYVRFEQGHEAFPLTVLESLATGYQREPGDFLSSDPPAPRDGLPGLWWRATPEVTSQMSNEDRRKLDALIREIDVRARAHRKSGETVRRANPRRRPKG